MFRRIRVTHTIFSQKRIREINFVKRILDGEAEVQMHDYKTQYILHYKEIKLVDDKPSRN